MKVLIAGDFCPQNRVAKLFEQNEFSMSLGEVKPIVHSSDYSIVNFECPVISGNEEPIEKCGPNLFCSGKGVDAIKWVGFDCVTLANNHIKDYGENGIAQTIEACRRRGIDCVGGGMNLLEASKVLYKEICGQKLAIINCCEHEFSIATEKTAGSNPLNVAQQYYAIKEARQKADYVLAIVHGGHEHYQLPSPRMQETYRFFIDVGADAVVNHHQHCFSGYEFYNGKPILYGLGNFCFDGNRSGKDIWNEGYMAMISFDESVQFEIIPYVQCKETPAITILDSYSYIEKIEELNSIINNPKELVEVTERYYNSCASSISNVLEPLGGRLYIALKRRGLLPSLVSKKRRLLAADLVNCESHRDKLISYLSDK